MSSKDIEKKFVGQPIFKQLIALLPKSKFDFLALEPQLVGACSITNARASRVPLVPTNICKQI